VPPLIAEELLVLAYEPDGLARGSAIRLDCALAGALLLELIVDGSVVTDGDQLSAVADADPAPLRELAKALASIAQEPSRTAQQAVLALASGLRRRLLAGLVDRGVLGDEVHRWLGVLQRHRFPERDPAIRADILRRLRAPTDPRTLGLAAMVIAAGLGDTVWSAEQRCAVHQRLSGFVAGTLVIDAVARAVRTSHARTMT